MSVKRLATLIVAVVMLGALIPATALAAPGGGGGTPNNLCPSSNSLANFVSYSNVAASSTGTATSRTYFFESFTSENPVNGVPGLTGYCVYPTDQQTNSASASPLNWTATVLKGTKGFVFQRTGGDKNNVPLDGNTYTIGTAQFDAWTAETILLHINDAAQCTILYGAGSSASCWVYPSAPVGPVCDTASASDSNAAYNDIPKDAVDCGPPSEAFEAQSASEFGDQVTLSGSGTLLSLTVLFNSYACEDHPLWNNSECYTSDPNATFQHGITANIYAASSGGAPGALLATAEELKTIPFRPSADNVNCTDADAGAFLNPISGNCEFSKKVLLTFTDWGSTQPSLSGNVIWTVAYNTTHYGYSPINESAECYTTTAGCPYDSLNVGTKTFPNAPYAGDFVNSSDAFLNSSWTGAYCDNGSGGTGTLRQDASCWSGLQPLGKIVLAP